MKKLLLKCILVLTLINCVGCTEHKHKYGEWVINEYGHYHPLICDGCTQPTVMEPHADLNIDNKCDECGYDMGDEHLFMWNGTAEGHHKKALCGCCNYPEEVYPHIDDDKDNICDMCKYSMFDINISWLYTETHHWYQYGDQTEVYEYGPHIDDNKDLFCDECHYLYAKYINISFNDNLKIDTNNQITKISNNEVERQFVKIVIQSEELGRCAYFYDKNYNVFLTKAIMNDKKIVYEFILLPGEYIYVYFSHNDGSIDVNVYEGW